MTRVVGVLIVAFVAGGCGQASQDAPEGLAEMPLARSGPTVGDPETVPAGVVVEVFKDPSCGCCLSWADHLAQAGFTVRSTDTPDLLAVKASHGVPPPLQACHTAIVDGYVVEGHVPAADIHRLLAERPDVAGLAVPGMPIGSPGMEMPGQGVQPYEVLTFTPDGTTAVFARYGDQARP